MTINTINLHYFFTSILLYVVFLRLLFLSMTLEIKVVAWDGHKRNMAGFTFVQSSEGLRRLLPGDPRLSIVGKEGWITTAPN
jgi:hypothetical protein